MRRFLRRNRSEVLFGAALVTLATAFAAVGMAGTIGNNTDPPGTLDGRVDFSIVDTNNPSTAAGRITKIDYYAGAAKPMAFMVVAGSYPNFTVKYISETFTPAIGVRTFTPPANWMVSAGDNIAMYFEQEGVVPFTSPGDPAAYTPGSDGIPSIGETLTMDGQDNRTYSFVATVLEPTTTCTAQAKPYTGWDPVQSLFVPANDADGVAGPAFTNGIGYKVEAAGFYYAQAGPQYPADAEFSLAVGGSTWTDFVPGAYVPPFNNTDNDLLDLRINGAFIAWATSFAPDHVYTHDIVGTGALTDFGFGVDENEDASWFADNTGGLCVSVLEDAMGPTTTGVAVNPSLVKVGSTVAITATVNDDGKGDSWIKAAEWKVNVSGPGPFAMNPVTALDSKVEAFTANFANVPAGVHDICVRGQDKAENWGEWSCGVTLKVYDRYAKISGVIAGSKLMWKDTGEPDWAFDGMIYAAGPTQVWGSISVNYKILNQTCTYTADGSTLIAASLAGPARVDVSELLNSCDGKRYTFQLLNRGGFGTPRGGVFISEEPGDYFQSTPYELFGAAGELDWYVPLDRGNVILWTAV